MKAVILTAGSGRRMRPLTDATHKTLLVIRGRTVIQWIVDALLENGIADINIVTGYQAAAVQAHLAEVYPAVHFNYIHNPRHAQTNNIFSMALALDNIAIDGDVLLMECDLVFEPAVLRRLLDAPHPNVALVDRHRCGMDGTVVTIADGMITDVVPPHRQGADFCFDGTFKTLNIYRFAREFCAGPFKKLLDYYAAAVSDNVFYELVLGIIIHLQHAVIHAEVLHGEQWAELDDPNDLDQARFLFDPAVRPASLAAACGGYWNYDILDCCFIRNMYFPSGSVISELRNALPSLLQNYGSAQTVLNAKMACYLLCDPANVIVLNGLSQAYPWLQRFCAGRRALIPTPTFGEYPRIFPDALHYGDAVGLDADEISARANDADLVVLVNPNNPTGSVLSTAWIYAFAAAHPGHLIIVDESFIDFSGQPSLLADLTVRPLPNVLLLKSLGKSLGVPGLRLGYVYTANREFHDFARAAMPIWNLNSMAEHFLEIILKHRDAIQASFARTIADRATFAAALRRVSGIERVYDSGGNFLLVALHGGRADAPALVATLLRRHGIYLKDVSERLPGDGLYLRLAVRLPEENARLTACLAEALVARNAAADGRRDGHG